MNLRLPGGVIAFKRQTLIQTQLVLLACDLLAMDDMRHQQLHRTVMAIAACMSRKEDGGTFANARCRSLHFCQDGWVYYAPGSMVWFGNLLPAEHRLRTFGDDFMSILAGRSALVADVDMKKEGCEVLRPEVCSVTLTDTVTLQLDLFGDVIARQSNEDAIVAQPVGMPANWISNEDDKLAHHVWNIMLGLLLRDSLLPENVDLNTLTVEKGKLRYQLKRGVSTAETRTRLVVA
ncbi:MAG TPA: hypothetical protein VGE62_00950 [Candidatus Paceibacterota bacterium]